MKNIIKEPLLHFLVLGALLYIFYTLNATDTQPKDVMQKATITLNKNNIEQLQKEFTQTFHRSPSPQMMQLLIKNEIQKEILLHEAYKLKLYKEDKAIQKLLLQKMHFILNAATKPKEPSEEQLHNYYTKHIKEFSQRENISFYAINFTSLTKEAQKKFYTLVKETSNFHDFKYYKQRTPQEIRKEFGTYFLQKILQLPKQTLSHAIATKNGIAFVYITDYNTTTPYSFDAVQERVYKDYLQEKKHLLLQKLLATFKKSYTVIVQP